LIVSFHPRLAGDVNLRFPRGSAALSPALEILGRASAVLLPQSVRPCQFWACLRLCPNVFPDYRWRFGYEGKYGAAALFAHFRVPHPRTLRYSSVAEFRAHCGAASPPLGYPFVLKGDRGGGGSWVFLIGREADLARPLACLEVLGWPLIIQEYVEHGGRDARVVVMGEQLFSYWRRQPDPGEFRNNLGRGAALDYDSEPERLRAAEAAVLELCRRTRLNLAAFDLLFGRQGGPLFCEINYNFGRKGLARGGDYDRLLAMAVRRWRGSALRPPAWGP
jgi:ribosomal protein S6--L-glutamate ligase